MAKKIEKAAAKSAPTKSEKKPKVPKAPKVIIEEAKVKLVQFSIKAVIPVQQYGNMQPEIVVTAPTIEEATEYALPIMEGLYQQYAEILPGMKVPAFFNKASVTATEKVVPQATVADKLNPPVGTVSTPAQAPMKVTGTTPAPKEEEMVEDAPKSAGFAKGTSMIAGCMSREALDVVEEQIKKSEKLASQEKDELLTLVLKKRKEF